MAPRVNTRFILIMLVTIALGAGAVWGLWRLQSRGDAERLARQGDEFFAQGEHTRAMESFRRAVRRDPGNLDYLEKYKAAIMQHRPETTEEARQLYEQWFNALRLEANYRATDPEAHLQVLEEIHTSARLLAHFASEAAEAATWRQLRDAAGQMLVRVPDDDPKHAYGHLYHAMAALHLRRALTERELQEAEQELIDFNKAVPNHDLGRAALAEGQFFLEEQARLSGDSRRLSQRQQRLHEVMKEVHAETGTRPYTATVYARYLVRHSTTHSPSDLDAALDTMIAAVAESDSSWLVFEAVNLLPAGRGREGAAAGVRLLEQHLYRDPDALAHRFSLARLHFQVSEFDEADAAANAVLAQEGLPVSFLGRMKNEIQAAAAGMLADIEFQRWTHSPDDQVRVEAMREARERLATFVTDPAADPRTVRVDAKLALMENRHHDAAERFERLIRDGVSDPLVFSGAAYSLQRTGELGLALERATAAVAAQRTPQPGLILLQAELEFQLGRLEAASETIRRYLTLHPTDDRARRLSMAITARQRGEPWDADDPVATAVRQAESALRDGEAESARAVLMAVLQTHPEDPRLLGMLGSLEMRAGNVDSAREYISRALEFQPDALLLRQLDLLARTGDPVDAALEFYREAAPGLESETDRAAGLLRTLVSMRTEAEAEVAQFEGRGDTAAEAAAKRLHRVHDELPKAVQRLRSLSGEHPVLIEFDFNEAIRMADWTQAGQIVQRARRTNADLMNGLLYEGRFELERRPARPEEAVRAFQRATELRPASSMAWRALAVAYRHVGNFREALRAYEQAHAINPVDPETIRSYLGLLMQTGDQARALRVARDASRVMPGNLQFREMWLELEAEHGNPLNVLVTRLQVHSTNPGDRINTRRLALLLVSAEPRYDLLIDSEGKPAFTERRWNQLSPAEQRRILDETRQNWQAEAGRLVDEYAERFGDDLDSTLLRAAFLRAKGDVAGGERAIRQLVDRNLAQGAPSPDPILALSRYQLETGQQNEAMATIRLATEFQNPKVREADLAMADLLFSRGQYEQAMQRYQEVVDVAPQRAAELRIIECAANLRQFDKAATALDRFVATHGSAADLGEAAYTIEILRGMIAHGRATDHLLAGRTADADREMGVFSAALDAAQRLAPANPAPHIVRAQSMLEVYRRTRNRAMLEDAFKALDRADAVRAGDPQTVFARVDLHRAAGNPRAAIGELTRLLDRMPANIPARRLLMQLHVEAENYNAARDLITQAMELYPTVAAWPELLGNLHALRNDHGAAAAAYRKAYELSGAPGLLARQIGMLITPSRDNPDFPGALRVLQNEREAIERDPMLEALYAHVLTRAGRADEGKQRLRRSYNRARAQITPESGRSPAEIGAWYQAAGPYLAALPANELDALINEFTNDRPDNHDLLWLSRLHSGRGMAGLSRASDLLLRAVETAPETDTDFRADLLFELSNFQIMMEEFSVAAQTLQRVVELRPNDWAALNNLAFLLAEYLNDPNAALGPGRRAFEIRPTDAAILDTMGWIHFKLERYDRAEEYLRDSLTVQETPRTLLHMAHVLAAMGRFEAALSRLRRAAELNPDTQTRADIDRLADDIRTKRASAQ